MSRTANFTGCLAADPTITQACLIWDFEGESRSLPSLTNPSPSPRAVVCPTTARFFYLAFHCLTSHLQGLTLRHSSCQARGMKFTYYGHSCFSVFAGGKTILFDPFVTPNPLAEAIDIDTIKADYIIASHGHFDHTTDLIRIARRTGAKVLGNWELYQWFNKNHLTNTHPINPGGQYTFDFGTVKCFIAQHSSSLPDGSYGGTACGFAIRTPDGNFYYSGDTALTTDMQLVPDWTTLDFAILPVGDGLTMGVQDAIKASRLIGVTKVVGVHYDTFDFIKLDHSKATEAFREAGVALHLLSVGSVTEI